jgi:hypothetical protein
MTTKLEEFADKQAQARFIENQEIARSNRVLRAELDRSRSLAVTYEAELKKLRIEAELTSTQLDRPDWILPPKKVKPTDAIPLAALSDVHASEVVNQAEMNGYNKYNLAIAEIRLQKFFSRTIKVARSWSNYVYAGILLAVLGDLVSGDIHDELVQTNECSNQEAVLWLVPRIAEGVELFRKEFKKVHVGSAPGNHGRDNKIPRYKKRSAHNADTLIMRLVAREFNQVPDVTFEIPESLDTPMKVYGYAISLEHGEELARNFNQGSAEVGALGPLQRGTNRKKTAYAAEGHALDYALWGHFHQLIPVASRGFVANGSVKGYDEFARGLKFKPERPQQVLMAVSPEWGILTETPIIVADRQTEGW